MSLTATPLFSIITVVFNDRENLLRTMKSVISQRCNSVEYIVIDGGSGDGSVEVIKQHQDRIAHWISEKDTGIYHAMNKGLSLAKGRYVNFLNAGDTYASEDTLDLIGQRISEAGPDIIYGQSLHTSVNNSHVNFVKGEVITIRRLLKSVPFCHQAVFKRRVLFDELGSYSLLYRMVADYEWMVRYIGNRGMERMLFVPLVVVNYDTDGLSFNYIEKTCLERRKVVRLNFSGWLGFFGSVYSCAEMIRVFVVLKLQRLRLLEFYRSVKYRKVGAINSGGTSVR